MESNTSIIDLIRSVSHNEWVLTLVFKEAQVSQYPLWKSPYHKVYANL